MKRVNKYVLNSYDGFGIQTIDIPSQRILSVESQRGEIVVYALVDTEDLTPVKYQFAVYGTGFDIMFGDNFDFLGTVKMHNDKFVFHVFYRRV